MQAEDLVRKAEELARNAAELARQKVDAMRISRGTPVIVEATLEDVLEGAYGTRAHPMAILGWVVSICVGWGVPVHFCASRQAARIFTESYLRQCWRMAHDPTAEFFDVVGDEETCDPDATE